MSLPLPSDSLRRPTPAYMVLPEIDPPPQLKKRPNTITLQVQKIENRMMELFERYQDLKSLYNKYNFVPQTLLDRLSCLETDLHYWTVDSVVVEKKIPFSNEKNNPLTSTMKKVHRNGRELVSLVFGLHFASHTKNERYYDIQIMQLQLKSYDFPCCC